jgi:hypothetical protein
MLGSALARRVANWMRPDRLCEGNKEYAPVLGVSEMEEAKTCGPGGCATSIDITRSSRMKVSIVSRLRFCFLVVPWGVPFWILHILLRIVSNIGDDAARLDDWMDGPLYRLRIRMMGEGPAKQKDTKGQYGMRDMQEKH